MTTKYSNNTANASQICLTFIHTHCQQYLQIPNSLEHLFLVIWLIHLPCIYSFTQQWIKCRLWSSTVRALMGSMHAEGRTGRQAASVTLGRVSASRQSLTDQQALGMLLSLPHNGRVTVTHNDGQLFKWMLGIWTQVSMLEKQVLLSTELSSQPWCLISWPIGYGARMELCTWIQGSQKTVNSKDRLLCVLWPEVKSNSNANEYRSLAALTVEHAATAALVLNTEHVHFALCTLLYCADWWTLPERPRLRLNWCITNCSGHMKFSILIEALLLKYTKRRLLIFSYHHS